MRSSNSSLGEATLNIYKSLGRAHTRQPDGRWNVAEPNLGEGLPSEGLWVQPIYWKKMSPGSGFKTPKDRTPGVITLGLKSVISLDPWIPLFP